MAKMTQNNVSQNCGGKHGKDGKHGRIARGVFVQNIYVSRLRRRRETYILGLALARKKIKAGLRETSTRQKPRAANPPETSRIRYFDLRRTATTEKGEVHPDGGWNHMASLVVAANPPFLRRFDGGRINPAHGGRRRLKGLLSRTITPNEHRL
jgi:hypothetical protein